MTHALRWLFLLVMAGCPSPKPAPVDTGADSGNELPDDETLRTLSGELVWSLDFTDEAEAAGAFDCTYRRGFHGIEDRSAPWACPDCEVLFRAEVTLEGEECRAQISSRDPWGSEWVGWTAEGELRRGIFGTPTQPYGDVTWVAEGQLESVRITEWDQPPGAMTVAGSFELGSGEGDPLHGVHVPESYACGWPKADPAPYDGPWQVQVGSTVPDGVFGDACGEGLRLHDLAGSYLVIDASATDCGPCQVMADGQQAFLDDMAVRGIPVRAVTLLIPSLSDVSGIASPELLDTWDRAYGLDGPTVADRGWGYAMSYREHGNMAWPTWVVVAPDLEVLAFERGFTADRWQEVVAPLIEAHASGQQ